MALPGRHRFRLLASRGQRTVSGWRSPRGCPTGQGLGYGSYEERVIRCGRAQRRPLRCQPGSPSRRRPVASSLLLTPDGGTVVCGAQFSDPSSTPTRQTSPASGRNAPAFVAYSAATGKFLRVLYQFTGVSACRTANFLLWSDDSARDAVGESQTNVLGQSAAVLLHVRSGRRRRIPPSSRSRSTASGTADRPSRPVAGGSGKPRDCLGDRAWCAAEVHPSVADALRPEGGTAHEGHLGVLKCDLRRVISQPSADMSSHARKLASGRRSRTAGRLRLAALPGRRRCARSRRWSPAATRGRG